MLRNQYSWLVIILFTLPNVAAAQGGKDYGQFAPEDAYLDSSGYAYYGSENEWSRRMFSQQAADRFYKRRGQRQLLAILDGQPQQAVELCEKRLETDPDDQESLFVLTVAWCSLGQVERAFATMQRALDSGLPFERFLAGPRRLLEPLTASAAFQTLARKRSICLLHGPLLGAVTDHSARFWVRTAGEAEVTVRAFSAQGGERLQRAAAALTRSQHDYTAVIEVDSLASDTLYGYDLEIDGESVLAPDYPRFRTFPIVGQPAHFKIGFGGGAGFTPAHERIWQTIKSLDPLAFLFLGDNVYIDLPQYPGSFHQYTYYRRQSRPEFRALVRSSSIFAIWDDHDCAIDDVWLGPFRDKPDWKLPMLDVFRTNWNNPAYGDAKWPGCWFRFSIADVDFFMLDGRFYRTNPFADHATMLGPVQKAWLFAELQRSTATFKVVVSPVPWAPDAKPGSRDTWDGFGEEREEIFRFIEDQHVGGVVLLSADRHRSDAWKINRPNGYPLYDLMSSKLTNLHTHEIVPGALFSYNETCSFGLLTFDTGTSDPQVRYQVVDIDGKTVHQLQITRSQLEN